MSRLGASGGGASQQHGTRHQRPPPYSFLTTSPSPSVVDAPLDFDEIDDVVVNSFVSSAPGGTGSPLLDALTSSSRPTGSHATPPTMSMAVLMLIIVASLSAVVGAIYLLIYFKSIKPMSARSRSYADPGGGKGDDDSGPRKSAGHPFFRRK